VGAVAGAGQELFDEKDISKDASGNRKLNDIGRFLGDKLIEHNKALKRPVNLKYIDPSYIIRAMPASPTDAIFCRRLGENAVHAALAGTFRYVLADRRLTLFSGTEPSLAFEAEPAPALEGVTWTVTGFNNGRQAVVSPLSGTSLSLTFKGGRVEGFAGCNSFRATYTAEADRIVIGPAAVTRMSCGGDGVMQQERLFLSALASATTWGFVGKLLDMHRADGERVLTAAGN